ncbi:FecR domain-containing protein [Candidatus Woesearchaeota archaeon]|nr:FecR domain-containing protein [Candidatus Woesearchaeota archaeon]
MDKKAVLAVLFFIVILSSFILAEIEGSCVTYEQARANTPSLASKSDAELYRMGFCPGTATQATPAAPSPASPAPQGVPAGITTGTSDLSSKSVDELSNLHMQLHNMWSNGLYDPDTYDRSLFDNAMKTVWDMRSKELDDSWKRSDVCYDACSGEKFQRGGGGQACVQPCLDRAYAEGDKVVAEIERLEKAAYIDDINRLQAVLGNKAPEVKGELPKGPKFDTRDDRGLTKKGLIAPDLSSYVGDAYVKRADGTKVIPGKELYLNVDDSIITGKESKINIIFGNAGKMQLGPDTKLRVGSALLDQYYLAEGQLRTRLDWTAGLNFRLETMNANIFVKGTEFVTEYNETTNTTTVYLQEGELEIDSGEDAIILTAGNYCTIGPDGTITSGEMESADWDAMDEMFYEAPDQDAANKMFAKMFSWLSFASLMVSSLVAMIFFYREKKRHKEGHKKEDHKGDLGWLSIIFGILGIVTCIFPMIGFPLTFASTTLARIQKLRDPTTSARIGHIIGGTAAVLNGIVFIVFFAYTGSL